MGVVLRPLLGGGPPTVPSLSITIAFPRDNTTFSTAATFDVYGYVFPNNTAGIALIDGWVSVNGAVVQYLVPGSFSSTGAAPYHWKGTFNRPPGTGSMMVTVRICRPLVGGDQDSRSYNFQP